MRSLNAFLSLIEPSGQGIGTAGLFWKWGAQGSSLVSLPSSWEGYITELLIIDWGGSVQTNVNVNVFCRRESWCWENLYLVQWKREILLLYRSSTGSHEWQKPLQTLHRRRCCSGVCRLLWFQVRMLFFEWSTDGDRQKDSWTLHQKLIIHSWNLALFLVLMLILRSWFTTFLGKHNMICFLLLWPLIPVLRENVLKSVWYVCCYWV